ncbi:MAG: hypothetical protein RL322_1752 [Pseudomonadota bacterium]|jgi:hypothetical protein
MTTPTQTAAFSHPAIERFEAALENARAMLHLLRAFGASVAAMPLWSRMGDAIIQANQRRVEAMIARDPRFTDEIRSALLRNYPVER